jgi:low temperature requirement protein LtrA
VGDVAEPWSPAAPEESAERHASWAELFFDLVAVAGVAMLAHLVAGAFTPRALGLYVVLFLAFWFAWTAYMIYGNVAGERVLIARLLAGMFGLGVMAASVPGVAEFLVRDGDEVAPARAFAIAYVAARIVASQSWRRGQIVLDFPVMQHTVGVLPWIASIWVDDHAWKVGLWAAGVAIDVVVSLAMSGDDIVRSYEKRVAQLNSRAARRRSRRNEHRPDAPQLEALATDPAHLAERLGLFVIIVLGEGVVQVVDAASESAYDASTLAVTVAGFLLLSGLFGVSVLYGHAGVPHLHSGDLDVRRSLVLHVCVTGMLATVAVALAAIVEHATSAVPDGQRWLLCGAVAGYFALGLVASGVRRLPLRVTAVWALTGVVAPALLGWLGARLTGTALIAIVTGLVATHLAYEWRRAQGVPEPSAGG